MSSYADPPFLQYENIINGNLVFSKSLTSIKLSVTALVQSWWAFETLLNDFAGIIREQRKDKLTEIQALMLDEKAVFLNKKGEIEDRILYQPLENRLQFIYNFITGKTLDRSGTDWQNLMNLKNARVVFLFISPQIGQIKIR